MQASEVALVEDIVIDHKSYGKAFTMRHDILIEHKEKGLFILDTKYKEMSRFKGNPLAFQNLTEEAKQPDLYQMFTYAIKRNLKKIYLLYPMYRFEEEEDSIPTMTIPFQMDGMLCKLVVHVIRLPFIFEDDAGLIKQRLASALLRMFE